MSCVCLCIEFAGDLSVVDFLSSYINIKHHTSLNGSDIFAFIHCVCVIFRFSLDIEIILEFVLCNVSGVM